MKKWYVVDDCMSTKGEIFTTPAESLQQAREKAAAEWAHLSEHDRKLRDAFYIGFADTDDDGCVDFDTMTDTEEIGQIETDPED